jgi:hypothetical protein
MKQAQCNGLGVMVHTWAPYLETVVISGAFLGAIASVIE